MSQLQLLGSVTLARLWQYSKARFPMRLTLSGMLMLLRFVQPVNASASIDVKLFGNSTCLRFLQFSKARSPISVTPAGRVMFFKDSQAEKE